MQGRTAMGMKQCKRNGLVTRSFLCYQLAMQIFCAFPDTQIFFIKIKIPIYLGSPQTSHIFIYLLVGYVCINLCSVKTAMSHHLADGFKRHSR